MGIQRMQEATSSYGKTMESAGNGISGMAGGSGVRGSVSELEAAVRVDTERGTAANAREEAEQTLGSGSTAQIKMAVEEINKRARNSEAVFGIHDATNRVTIKIIDKDTKEVLKEYPPEKTLDMIAKVWEVAGLLVDEKL